MTDFQEEEMSMDAGSGLMTAEEFYTWGCQPEYEDKHLVLVRGRPLVMPLPDPRHGVLCANLCYFINEHIRGRRMGYVCMGAGFIAARNPDTVYGPDLALYDKHLRFEDIPDEYDDIPPRFIAEVRAFYEEMDYLLAKTADYLSIGVGRSGSWNPQRGKSPSTNRDTLPRS
jgi:Uma2 family endonuclease